MGLHQSDRRQDLVIELVFLEHDSRHRTEKPYKLQYDPGDEIPRWNCQNEPHNGIRIEDMRGREHDFSISTHGFQVMKLSSQLPAVDFYDDAKVKTVYYDELKTLLKASFRADGVEILEHGIRKRHPQFPVSTGEDYDHLQPTSVVHIGEYRSKKIHFITLMAHKQISRWMRLWRLVGMPSTLIPHNTVVYYV